MAVALVHSTVGGQEVKVMFAFWIPHRASRGSSESTLGLATVIRSGIAKNLHYWERVVVMGCKGCFTLDSILSRGRVVAGGIWCAGGMKRSRSRLQGRAVCATRSIGRASADC